MEYSALAVQGAGMFKKRKLGFFVGPAVCGVAVHVINYCYVPVSAIAATACYTESCFR